MPCQSQFRGPTSLNVSDSTLLGANVRNCSGGFCIFSPGMVGQNRVLAVKKLATSKRSHLAASIAAGGLVLAAMPTAGLALGALDQRVSLPATGSFAALTPASVDPRLAKFVARRSNGRAMLMRFTPAATCC